ncbi:hypothetical protein QTP88_009775 [Uroleucon formosanum]
MRHNGMGFSEVPNLRINLTQKPRVSSSSLTSTVGMSVGIPLRTTFRERSSGREKPELRMIGGGVKLLTAVVVWFDTEVEVDFSTDIEVGFGTEVEVGFGTEVGLQLVRKYLRISVDVLVSEKDAIVSESERFGEGDEEGGDQR